MSSNLTGKMVDNMADGLPNSCPTQSYCLTEHIRSFLALPQVIHVFTMGKPKWAHFSIILNLIGILSQAYSERVNTNEIQ